MAETGGDRLSLNLMERGRGDPLVADLGFLDRTYPNFWPDYNDAVYRPHHINSQAFIASTVQDGPQFIFGLASDDWSERQSIEAQALLKRLEPIIRQSATLRAKLLLAEGRTDALRGATDNLRTGMIWLDGKGVLRDANIAAQAMLTANDGLLVKASVFCAGNRGDQAAIERAVVLTASGAPMCRVAIRRPSGKRSYVVNFVRVQKAIALDGVRIAAYVTDPEAASPRVAETAVLLLGLTGAEGEIAQLLCEGLDPATIARIRKSSIATVRTQIGAILAKSGLSRQIDLVSVLLAAVGDRR
jgi:DNA-binding CsgD family transcriptional regulator